MSNNGVKKMTFADIIKDKKVLLLGPAPHILEPSNTEDWKSFDIIVKLNKMVENLKFENEELNHTNHILYHCLDINESIGDLPYCVDSWVNMRVQHVRVSPPPITHYYKNNIDRFILKNNFKLSFSIVGKKHYLQLVKMCNGTIPNTGTFAIYDLMNCCPKELHIRGLTFFKGGYAKKYKNAFTSESETREIYKSTSHDIDEQINFFKHFYREKKESIFLDKELEMLLNNLEKK
jgi:hypothetical protein